MTRQTYGPKHVAERARVKPEVDAGLAYCAEVVCLYEQETGDQESRWIEPGTDWHLAHDRKRPGQYHGPAHARCNDSEGGTVAHEPKAPEFWPL
jgi:hypothetical protein